MAQQNEVAIKISRVYRGVKLIEKVKPMIKNLSPT
jgi:hypothetical protein